MNILLSPELEEMVKRKVESGDYGNESEVVAAALRRMQKQERHAWLREAVGKGLQDIDQGNTVRMTPELREEMIQNAIRRAGMGEKPCTDVTL